MLSTLLMESGRSETITNNGSQSSVPKRSFVSYADYKAKRKLSGDQSEPDRPLQRRRDSYDIDDASSRSFGSPHGDDSNHVFSQTDDGRTTPVYDGETPDSPPDATPADVKGCPADQYEEDDLSRINWNDGRKQVNGLFSCLYDHRRKQTSGLKKKVRFVSDAKIQKVQFFEMEEDERANVFRLKMEAQEKGIPVDYHLKEKLDERKVLESAQRKIPDESPWYKPVPIANLPPLQLPRGINSIEVLILRGKAAISEDSGKKTSSAISGLNVERENLPDSPDEPDVMTSLRGNSETMKVCPLRRPGMENALRLPPTPLTPHGPLPQPVPAPPVTPVQYAPPPMGHSPPRAFQGPPMDSPRVPFTANPPPTMRFPLSGVPVVTRPPHPQTSNPRPETSSFPPLSSRSSHPQSDQQRGNRWEPKGSDFREHGSAHNQNSRGRSDSDNLKGTRDRNRVQERAPNGRIICVFHRRGGCKNGSSCKFEHC